MSLAYTSHNPTSFNFNGDSYTAHELNYENFDDLIGDLTLLEEQTRLDMVDLDYTDGAWSATYADIPGDTMLVGGFSYDAFVSQSNDALSQGYLYQLDYGVGQHNIEGVDYEVHFGVAYQTPSTLADTYYWGHEMANTISQQGHI